jgi:C-terminal processing protease CtpA/Prc
MFCCLTGWAQQQPQLPGPERAPQLMTSEQLEQARAMLRDVAGDVKMYYYDPHFHGKDWDAVVRETRELVDHSSSINMAMAHIAGALDSLNDSHTFFVGPQRPYLQDYGFQFAMIGNRCFITRVRPGSDGETKGVMPGDELVSLNGYRPTRENLWEIKYAMTLFGPRALVRLNLNRVGGGEEQVDVSAKIVALPNGGPWRGWELESENEELAARVRYMEMGNDLLIVKIPAFTYEMDTATILGRMRKHSDVILDLRDDQGGRLDMLQTMLGSVLGGKVKIGDRVTRDSKKDEESESERHPFTGKLIVLVNSESASAAEIFARVIQLQKRGALVGDLSSGKVMEAEHYLHRFGMVTVISYAASVTVADLIMTDGQSLEHKGVVPDFAVLPTPMDVLNGRDPALAKAAELLGVQLSPEEAGKLFPYEWPKD